MTNLTIATGVMTGDECSAVCARAEALGFSSMARVYPPSYRNNDRVLLDDPALAAAVFARVRAHLPTERRDEQGGLYRLCGVNSRFRICRYRDGQRFSIHRDGSHASSDRMRSLSTVMIYLNEPPAFDGGRTRFYATGRPGRAPTRVVVPQRGSAAIFDHDLWHDGEAVTRGDKYVLRTDVIYESEKGWRGAHDGYVWCLAPGPRDTLASGSRDCRIRLWTAGEGVSLDRELEGHESSVVALALHEQDLFSASRDGELRRWRGDTSTVVRAGGAAILSMVAAADGRLACVTSNGTLERWSKDGVTSVSKIHDSWIWGVARHDDALVTCSEDGSVRCRSRTQSWRAFVRSPLRALAVTPTGVLAGAADGRILRWTPDGLPRGVVGEHESPICALATSGEQILSGDENGRIYAWGAGEPTRVGQHRDQVRALVVRDDRLFSASYDGTIQSYPLSTAGAQRAARGHDRATHLAAS